MLPIRIDDGRFQQLARLVAWANDDMRAASLAKRRYDVSGGDEIAALIHEKSIPKESVVKILGRRKLIQRIHDLTQGRGDRVAG